MPDENHRTPLARILEAVTDEDRPDDGATVPVPLLEESATKDGTPPPLPPSPASAAAEVWLEDAVTRPSMLSDIAGSASSSSGAVVPIAAAPFAAYTPDAAAARHARMVLILTSATTFLLGIILGALLFRGR